MILLSAMSSGYPTVRAVGTSVRSRGGRRPYVARIINKRSVCPELNVWRSFSATH